MSKPTPPPPQPAGLPPKPGATTAKRDRATHVDGMVSAVSSEGSYWEVTVSAQAINPPNIQAVEIRFLTARAPRPGQHVRVSIDMTEDRP